MFVQSGISFNQAVAEGAFRGGAGRNLNHLADQHCGHERGGLRGYGGHPAGSHDAGAGRAPGHRGGLPSSLAPGEM